MSRSARHPVSSPSAWRGADLQDDRSWVVELSEPERAEIVEATRRLTDEDLDLAHLDRDRFPLPSLGRRAVEWSAELARGRGFVLLRGFPVDLLTDRETELAYVGLGSHLGRPVGQDKDGSLLGHVRDEGVERVDPSVRLYRTRARQDFHTDGADLVGLLCLERARSGGESRIASSAAVYNEILARRPDLLEVLHEPFHWDRNDEQSPGEDPFFTYPAITEADGTPRVFYIGWYIRDAQRHPEVPPLTDAQLEAMELLESVANDPSVHVEMEFRPGDVQVLNNALILHAREAYEDDPGRRRHLLRLWLVAHHFAAVDDAFRGGIPQRDT